MNAGVRRAAHRSCGSCVIKSLSPAAGREITLVTTLLDAEQYPAIELAELYGRRWTIETNLRHLKQPLGMDVPRTKTVACIRKELAMFALVYNLIRLVMLRAAARQDASPERISFIDAMRAAACSTRPSLGRPDPRAKPPRTPRAPPSQRTP